MPVKETRNESEDDYEVPEPESEIEIGTEQEYQNEYGEDDDSVESSPKREVFIKKSKSQRRNQRRRYRTRVTRNQANIHVKERLDASHPKMRLGKGAPKNTRQKSRTRRLRSYRMMMPELNHDRSARGPPLR